MRNRRISKSVVVSPGNEAVLPLPYPVMVRTSFGRSWAWPMMIVWTPTSVSNCCRGDCSSHHSVRFGRMERSFVRDFQVKFFSKLWKSFPEFMYM
ncbi:hypothetical protein AVEN_122240-1 [Araneus ventricosus]|uniref:Uncharacterized protein n=1 Tax=Araneus ventricosus TaxID=182803 RepID=A0A4Y2H8U6_ARAVE|nr:hypothetical protein AVEN_122240-1 [Araneus ventricosus]